MERLRVSRVLLTAGMAMLAVAVPCLAEGVKPPVASLEVAGTQLMWVPQVEFERAVLRVAGPEGYALTKLMAAAPQLGADMLADAEPLRVVDPEGLTLEDRALPVRTLADGSYSYELVLYTEDGKDHVQTGGLRVSGGILSPVAPREPVAAGDEPGAAVAAEGRPHQVTVRSHGVTGDFDNFVSIRNVSGTGLSRVNLNTTDSIAINADTWRLQNDAGNNAFSISQGGTTNRLTIRQSGNVGLGTDLPLSPLHVVRGGGFQLRLDSGGTADYRFDAFGTNLRIGHVSNSLQFRIFDDSPSNALVVRGSGVGVGVLAPFSDLTIGNLTGSASTEMALVNSAAGATWFYSATGAGNFVISRAGTGGNEFTVRNRNHPTATLDVEGIVRGTAFHSTSTREAKTAFEEIDPQEILSRLADLPVTAWRYSVEGEGTRHIGPVAEDFQRLFGLGDGRSISTVDADGVMMAAIQGLMQRTDQALDRMARQLDAKEAEIARLRSERDAEIGALRAALAALEAALAGD